MRSGLGYRQISEEIKNKYGKRIYYEIDRWYVRSNISNRTSSNGVCYLSNFSKLNLNIFFLYKDKMFWEFLLLGVLPLLLYKKTIRLLKSKWLVVDILPL